jgi:hypothetical protein
MAYGSSTTISYLGTLAAGAMADGQGFATATQDIAARTNQAGNSHIQTTVSAVNATNASPATIYSMGYGDAHGNGAFTGVVPQGFVSSVGSNTGMAGLHAHATLMFGSSPIQMAQTFFAAQGLVSISEDLAPTLSKLNTGVEFGKFPNLDSLVYPADGVFPNYLGSGYPDYQAVVTNGISTLVNTASVANFQLLASDLTNLGNVFDLSDIASFGNPGQIIATLYNADGLTATGLDVVLSQAGVDPGSIFNLGSENYNVIMQSILDGITTPELIANAQLLLETNINLESLGDYTDFDKIFVNSRNVISFSTMAEFKTKLQALELGRIETVAELAAYINSVEPASLPIIGDNTDFVVTSYVDDMIAKFLGGTGPYGAITLSDMIGIMGGVVVRGHATQYQNAMDRLYSAGTLTALRSRMDELVAGLNGDYTVVTIVDPGPPVISTIAITDPFDSTVYTSYADFQAAKITQIESACASIISGGGDDVQLVIDSWLAIFRKVRDEKDFQSRVDMGYSIRTNLIDNAYSFVTGLRGTMNEYDKAPIITGMVDEAVRQGDVGGEYMRAYIKELENKQVADDYDIRWRAEFDE